MLSETAAVLIGADAAERELIDEIVATLGRNDVAALVGVGLPHVTRVLRHLTSILDGSAQSPGAALADAIVEIQRAIEAIESASPGSVATSTTSSVASPKPRQSEISLSAVYGDVNIMDEFVTEATDHLESAEVAVLALDANPGNADLINTIFRAFHTIKSTSSLLGLTSVTALAHAAEEVLDKARSGAIALVGTNADQVLAIGDVLKKAIGSLRGGGSLAPAAVDEMTAMAAALGIVAPAATNASVPLRAQIAGTAAAESTGNELVATSDASVRVTTERLDSLVNLVGELVVAQTLITNDTALRRPELAQLAQRAAHAHKILRRLQDLAMSLRMVPLRATFQKVTRLVHDLSRKSGKHVQLVCEGEDTEIDRNMVEHLNDPLIHMVRNAIGHGIETAQERTAAGKPETGTITLRAYHTAGNVVIEIEDDGRGLDREAIRATALKRGLLAGDTQPTDADLLSLIWLPGFSTVTEVSEVAGRGVGMDVVKRSIEALRGHIDMNSESGKGTHFSVRLPLTMAIIDAVLLKVGTVRLLLPTVAIVESLRPTPGSISSLAGKALAVHLRDEVIRILRLADVIKAPDAVRDASAAILVIIDSGGTRCALQVDHLLGQQQVVIKSLGAGFENVRGIAGAAILADGRIGLILDPAGLVGMANVDSGSQQQGVNDDNSGAAGEPQRQAQSGEVSHLRAWS